MEGSFQLTTLDFPLFSAFVALPLEDAAKRAFWELQERLRPYEDILTFQKPDSPHLTLYFWKELMQIEYDELLRQCERVVSLSEPFNLPIRGIETFGDKRGDRVLFLTPVFSPQLAELKKRCHWPNEPDKPFHPHITLARIKHAGKFQVRKKEILKKLADAELTMRVDRLRVYANVNGVSQTLLREWKMGIEIEEG
jgi:2'-5' RNA ligase